MKIKFLVTALFGAVSAFSLRASCPTCGEVVSGGWTGGNASPNISISMGTAEYGHSVGSLVFNAGLPENFFFTPLFLQYSGTARSDVSVLTTNVVTTNLESCITSEGIEITNFVILTNFITTFAGNKPYEPNEQRPVWLAKDSSGNIFYANFPNNVILKLGIDGRTTTAAGNGDAGYYGDGGPATNASLHNPEGIAIDGSGNLYIADSYNNVVRKVTSSGNISTVAGTGSSGYSGDGGAATAATLNMPMGLTIDQNGNLYIVDQYNHAVRKVTSEGRISTVAGTGSSGYSGDGGPAISATLFWPKGITVDASGNLYVVDTFNHAIRKITTGGIISTVAGTGTSGYSGDGGLATSAELSSPSGISGDSYGNFYIADTFNHVVRKVTSTGTICTLAGTGITGYSGDGGMALNATLYRPSDVLIDASGNLLIADSFNDTIRVITPNGMIESMTGNGRGYFGDGSDANQAALNNPSGVALDSSGNLYVADTGNNIVRRVSSSGIISSIAGCRVAGYAGDGGVASAAKLASPRGITLDSTGNLYIADTFNNVVRKVGSSGIISTVAGTGSVGYSGDGGAATSATLNRPAGVTIDSYGNLYIADTLNNVVRKVTSGGTISTVAGTGIKGYSGDGGLAKSATLDGPVGVTMDALGNLIVADTDNNVLRKVSSNGIITTFAGTGTSGYSGDGGTAISATLRKPAAVGIDIVGHVFIADSGNQVIREIIDGNISTVAGNGIKNYAGDGQAPGHACLNWPSGIAVNSCSNLFIGDTGNNVVRCANLTGTITNEIGYDYGVLTVTNILSESITNTILRQIRAPQVLADIPVPVTTNGFAVDLYYPTNIIGTNANGTYIITGAPFITWVFTNSSSPSSCEMRISQFGINPNYGLIKQYSYNYDFIAKAWTLRTLGGTTETRFTTNLDSSTFEITDSIGGSSGSPVQQIVKTYKLMKWPGTTNVVLVTNRLGAGAAAKITTYDYWDPATFGATSLAFKKSVRRFDGSWEYYSDYDNLGRPLKVYSSFQDKAANDTSNAREVDYTYDPNTAGVSSTGDDGTLNISTPRMVVKKMAGREIAREYHIFPSAGKSMNVLCTTPNPPDGWSDSHNLITTNLFYTSGDNKFELKSVSKPNGTLSTYSYFTNSIYRTNIVITGEPDASGTFVVSGESNVMVRNICGYLIFKATYDCETGKVISRDSYANCDDFGRPQQVTHLDGTTEYFYFACCGKEYEIDRDGITTVFLYDSDRRQYGFKKIYGNTASDGVTYQNVLDAVGHRLQTSRIGTDGSIILSKQVAYDTAGRMCSETNALMGVTSYLEAPDSLTGGLIRTITFPDGNTRIESRYLDGTIKSVTGTAVHPVRYEYGVETDANGNACSFVKEIRLFNDNIDSGEWVKTFTDMAGRTTETLYADGNYSQLLYNERGQMWKQVDADGVTALYTYNNKGRLNYNITAVADSTRAITSYNTLLGSLGNIFGGRDRVIQTTEDVSTDNDVAFHRSKTYVWQDGQSTGTLLLVLETAANGLNSCQTNYGDASTALISRTVTRYSTGARSITNTAPDGSYSVSTYSAGQLFSVIRYGSAGAQLSSTGYSYDSHGRLHQVTDVRNGPTIFAYNAADQVTSVTMPAPGGGQSSQTTTTLYDSMLRPYCIIRPDGNVVNTVYQPTGELARQYGSRTFPVTYGYDYAGRMQTVINWSSFGSSETARVTTWLYDGQRGWLVKKLYADSNGPSYTYTRAGRLRSRAWVRTDGDGKPIRTTYGYDAAGSLTNVCYSDNVTPSVTNRYDRLGRLTQQVTADYQLNSTYNLAGMLLLESYSGGPLNGVSVTNGYDQFLRRTSVTALGAALLARSSFGYDAASRLQTVSDDNNNLAAYSYIANSPLVSQIAFQQSVTPRMITTKQHDLLNRLTSLSSQPSGSGQPSVAFNYTYNTANQQTMDKLADGSYWIYQYDTLGQVTGGHKFFADGTPVPGQQFDYSFDTIGNRTQTKTKGDQSSGSQRVASYTANALNEVTSRDYPGTNDVIGAALATNSVNVNGRTAWRKGEYFWSTVQTNNTTGAQWQQVTVNSWGSAAGGMFVPQTPEHFAYDPDGNLTNDGRWSYTWDAENRLTGMAVGINVGPQYQVTFSFDPKSRRIQKVVMTNSVLLSSNKFIYDGWNLVAELKTNNSVVRSYMWGLDLSGAIQGGGGVGGLLKMSYYGTSTTNCFPAFDGNGNIVELVDAADGTVVANYEYAPFGEVIRSTGPMAKVNPFRYSTIYEDDECDLLMYAHRPYSASQGRFLSRDPLGELGANLLFNIGFMDVFGEESRLNPYWLVDNNPIQHYDVLGLQSVPVSLAEAIAQGNVTQVEAILAGMGPEDAGYAMARAWLKKVAECIAIHTAYKALHCTGCSACKTRAEVIKNAACLTAEAAGRKKYLDLKCDYCLAGSIARGSAKAEKGHQIQYAQILAQLAKCAIAFTSLPEAPPPGPVPTPTPN